MSEFQPFKNESQTVEIGNLKIENRLDKVSIYGDIDITQDKIGLNHARTLKSMFDQVVSTLEAAELPDAIQAPVVKSVPNPF